VSGALYIYYICHPKSISGSSSAGEKCAVSCAVDCLAAARARNVPPSRMAEGGGEALAADTTKAASSSPPLFEARAAARDHENSPVRLCRKYLDPVSASDTSSQSSSGKCSSVSVFSGTRSSSFPPPRNAGRYLAVNDDLRRPPPLCCCCDDTESYTGLGMSVFLLDSPWLDGCDQLNCPVRLFAQNEAPVRASMLCVQSESPGSGLCSHAGSGW
jgi:hypothetical protein